VRSTPWSITCGPSPGSSSRRVFLDAVCTHLVDLDPARDGATRYTGAYTSYLDAKRAERARWEQAHAEHLDEIAALQRAIAVTARRVAPGRPMRDRNKPAYDRHAERVQASISSRVRIARHRLDEVHRNPVPAPPPPLRFRAAVGAAAGDGTVPDGPGEHRPLVVAQPAVVPGRLELGRVEIASRDRLLVTGSNGAGKSTLLELLASPAAWHAAGVRVGLLPQEATFENPRLSPEQIYSKVVRRPADDAAGDGVPALAGLGLFPAADLHRPVAHLSTGQRRRLALAVLIASAPHVVLLDEPTNHLSLSLVEELENALRSAPAAVVIATHDRWLRRRWEGRELRLERGRALAPTSPD
jgi:macrolide transport system ATP-binding/permease protein